MRKGGPVGSDDLLWKFGREGVGQDGGATFPDVGAAVGGARDEAGLRGDVYGGRSSDSGVNGGGGEVVGYP